MVLTCAGGRRQLGRHRLAEVGDQVGCLLVAVRLGQCSEPSDIGEHEGRGGGGIGHLVIGHAGDIVQR